MSREAHHAEAAPAQRVRLQFRAPAQRVRWLFPGMRGTHWVCAGCLPRCATQIGRALAVSEHAPRTL
eukprot:351992-Chlamydomonas_euryale.AAC.8